MDKEYGTIVTEVLRLLKTEYRRAIHRLYGLLIIVMCLFVVSIVDSIYQRCRIIDILEEILPRDFCNQLLIEYDVKDNGLNPAIFYPGRDLISLSISKIDKWLKNNTESLGEYYKVSDLNLFSKYLFFYMIIHEIEHGYQFLIADDKIASPCVLVRDGYKGIFDLFDKFNVF